MVSRGAATDDEYKARGKREFGLDVELWARDRLLSIAASFTLEPSPGPYRAIHVEVLATVTPTEAKCGDDKAPPASNIARAMDGMRRGESS